tara:strand:- start:318 stop:644 length:327 start_codon:yes stop_codon:yes gene_type:complete
MRNQKTLDRLQKKAEDKGRMPSLVKISELLFELGIKHELYSICETKHTKPSGYTYTTGGGTRVYEGYTLRIPEINLNAKSNDSYYSYNTYHYARDIVELINNKLKTNK